jgi:hypothetical protein
MSISVPEGLPAELRQKFASMRRAQSITKTVTLLLAAVIVVEFAAFSYMTYYPIVDGLHDEARLQRAANEALPQVQPVIVDTVRKVIADVSPEYRKLAAARYEKVRASLGEKVTTEFNALPDHAEAFLGVELRNTFDRVIKRLEPELKEAFPTLSDAQRQDLLINHFAEAIKPKNAALAAKVDAIRVNETAKVKGILDSFALPPDSAQPRDGQIDKEFERVVLLLANEEIQERIDGLNAELGKPKDAK